MQDRACQSAVQYAQLRQSLAVVIDHALGSYWESMRSPEPDAILLAAQAEVSLLFADTCLPCIAHSRSLHKEHNRSCRRKLLCLTASGLSRG